jgi:hypothetical protein
MRTLTLPIAALAGYLALVRVEPAAAYLLLGLGGLAALALAWLDPGGAGREAAGGPPLNRFRLRLRLTAPAWARRGPDPGPLEFEADELGLAAAVGQGLAILAGGEAGQPVVLDAADGEGWREVGWVGSDVGKGLVQELAAGWWRRSRGG